MRTARAWIFVAVFCLSLGHPAVARSQDPLPSWNDGAAKTAIVRFVQRVSTPCEDFVPPDERIAVFDNDGTLWPEDPMPFQVAFALDSLRRAAPRHPEWRSDPVVQAALKGDLAALLPNHYQGLYHVMGLTHAGMTTDQFDARVSEWLATARHPRFNVRYDQLAYQPMLEVLAYLRAHRFKTFIVSGGGADFMRVWTQRVYGIPPEQVVGSYAQVRYELRDEGPVLVKTLDHLFVDDKAGKPVGIHEFIGRRPIAAFGNSDGDLQMLQWTTVGRTPSLGVIVHHTDAVREYAYDAHPKSSGKLVTALADAPQQGWAVVDMKHDWRRVFGEAVPDAAGKP